MAQADVRAALWEERTLVKTRTVRGTLHLHPSDELPLWTAARRAVPSPWWEAHGVSRAQADAAVDAVAEALDGRELLRAELADEVGRRTGDWAGELLASGWGHIVGQAAVEGTVVHGPPRGTKVTFVRADQWLPKLPSAPAPADALREACRRFLRAYGPGTPRTFADWFAPHLPPAQARDVFESLGSELVEVDVAGSRAWLLAAEGETALGEADGVRLLPEYDCYVMGFRERTALVPERAGAVVAAHGKGRFEGPGAVPWLLVDGVISGTWRRARRGRRIAIAVQPFGRMPAGRRGALDGEAARVGDFLGADTVLEIG